MKGLDLAGFDAKFRDDADPWSTFSSRDEATKRQAILHALGLGRRGRLWEPASGAGANSVALAPRALRLHATDGARAAVDLTAAALRRKPRARAFQLAAPSRPPFARYDAIVIAEVLYYLSPMVMRRFAQAVTHLLRPGGRLVLAHHLRDYYDFAQPAAGIHARFLAATRLDWSVVQGTATARWIVRGYDKPS